jgi:hypothetical protein
MALKITLRMKLLALVVGSYLTVMEYSNYRHAQLTKLYSTAVSWSSYTIAAESAVRKLNAYRGAKPTDLLVKLATGGRDFLDDRQELAIQLLVARGDANVTKRVAVLLQPSVGLARREAVATALQNAICNDECTRLVLHYLERRWSGFGIREDITNVAAHFDVGPEIEREQTQVVEELGHTLAISPHSTLFVLRDTYGLGSPVPSGFSLYILQSVHLKDACPFLEASEENLMDSSKDGELKRTLRELECPPTS